MKNKINILFGIISIGIGIYAVFKMSPDAGTAINFLTISFSLLALIWAFRAHQSLAENSSLRLYTLMFAIALTLIVLSNIMLVIETFTNPLKLMLYLRYMTTILAYAIFAAASYKILVIGEEFGFSDSTASIKEALKEKKRKK